jgi:hypothetical protein
MSCKRKTAILLDFIKNNESAKQGTAEWYAMRVFNIGGSEMSVITGENPYSKIEDLVATKVGFKKFTGNMPCTWGKIFEMNTNILIKTILNIKEIHETGSLPGAVDHQRYSPDGLAVIKTLYDTDTGAMYEYAIVLFEFKSPFSKIPDGTIPKHYVPQVKTGLCSIPISEYAIFINNTFRKCPLYDLDSSMNYDKSLQKNDKLNPTEVLAIGVNVFYQTETQRAKFYILYSEKINIDCSTYKYKTKETVYYDIYNNITDYGNLTYSYMGAIFKLYEEGLLTVDYLNPFIFETYYSNPYIMAQNIEYKRTIEYDDYMKYVNKRINKNCVGYMPWKLFISDIILEDREEGYVNKHKDKINEVIDILKDISAADVADKKDRFKHYFPNTKIV